MMHNNKGKKILQEYYYKGEKMPNYLLQISAKKVQNFIFQSTKFKHILGANAVVGSLFSDEFTKLKKKISAGPSIPWQSIEPNIERKYDLPWVNFSDGIIACSGGHFEALFNDKEHLEHFCKEAAKKARDCAPGLMLDFFMYHINLEDSFDPSAKYDNELDHSLIEELHHILNSSTIDNPFMQLSIDGEDPIPSLKDKSNNNEISYTQSILELSCEKIKNGTSNDYLTQWVKDLESEIQYESCDDIEELYKLSDTSKSNQVCMIKLDGNATGNLFRKKQLDIGEKKLSNSNALYEMEYFWLQNRESIRKRMNNAIQSAIKDFQNKYGESKFIKQKKLPLIVFMMGGDDILLLCIPEFAYPFIKYFFAAEEGITFSAGMLFYKHNYPILHAHNITETLLSSAKIKARENAELASSIDWHLLFSTKPESIETIRQQDYYISYPNSNNLTFEVLSQKPYRIKEALAIFENAERIVENFSKTGESEKTGRNKYKLIRSSIYKGHSHLEHLIKALNLKDEKWMKYDLINKNGNEIYSTQMLDIIELIDLFPELGNKGEQK